MTSILNRAIENPAKPRSYKGSRQAGITTVDAVIGVGALLVIAGVIEVLAMAISTQGRPTNLAAHTAEYARSKMDQLVTLCGGNIANRSKTAPQTGQAFVNAALPGCTDRTGAVRVPANGGSLDVSHPVARYVDYLDVDGKPVSPASRWEYVRVWEISVPSGGSPVTKQVAVKAQARHLGTNGVAPQSTIVTTRTFPLH